MSTDDHVTRKLDDWPYARAYVAETLDRTALERQASAMLSRAINVGRLIAFVSSGISMSYGRLAWSGLVSYVVNDVLERYRKIDRPPANLVTISENLSAIWPASDKKPRSVRSDRYPALFQYCERLDKALAELPPSTTRPDERQEPPLRDKVAALLYDDRGHAHVMMTELLADRKDFACPDLLKELRLELDFTRGKSGRDDQNGKWLGLFSAAACERLAEELEARPATGAPWRISKTLALCLVRVAGRSEETLPPTMRFLVPSLMRMLEPSQFARLVQFMRQDANTRSAQRRSVRIPPERDPLRILLDDLGIRRFLTTNYDLDIERAWADRGFSPRPDAPHDAAAGSSTESYDLLRASARDFVVSGPEAARLLEFSIQDRSGRLDLAHLHGRAAENEELVITEADYQKLYQGAGRDQEVVDDALSLIFASNPVLFVGNGMGEDDILRPLRHFVANKNVEDLTAIALLPMGRTEADDIEEKVGLHTRYGAHAIHYGRGKVQHAAGEDGKDHSGDRWLQHVRGMLKDMAEWLDDVRKAAGSKDAKKLDAAAEQYRSVVRSSLNESDVTRWPGFLLDGFGFDFALRELLTLEGRSTAEGGIDAANELAALSAVLDGVLVLARDPWGSDFGRLLDSVNALLSVIRYLSDACISLCVCAGLAKIEHDWRSWKTDWHQLPVPRATGGNRVQIAGTPVILRHAIALRTSPISREEGIPPGDRFFAGAPSQTFSALFEALDTLPPVSQETGRRVLVLLSRRGVGKGHFFAALQQEQRLKELAARLGSSSENRAGTIDGYAGIGFFNLNFSIEVSSVFDRLTSFLVDRAEATFGRPSPGSAKNEVHNHPTWQVWEASVSLRKNRVERLRKVVSIYAAHRKATKKRILFAFSGFNQLFDDQGEAKNSQLGRLVDAIIGPHGRDAPIDFIALTSDEGFPAIFKSGERPAGALQLPLVELRRPNASQRAEREIRSRLEGLKANVVWPTLDHAADAPSATPQQIVQRLVTALEHPADKSSAGKRPAFLHVLRDGKAISIIAAYFPQLALAIASLPGGIRSGDTAARPAGDGARKGAFAKPRGSRIADVAEAFQRRFGHNAGDTAFDKSEWARDTLPSLLLATAKSGRVLDPHLGEVGPDLAELKADFKYLYETFGRSRFVLSFVSAAASELVEEAVDSRTEAASALGLLRKIALELIGLSLPTRDLTALARVLDHYRVRHDNGEGLPAATHTTELLDAHLPPGVAEAVLSKLAGPSGWRLQQTLLWHLALCGHAVEADVLARAPEIVRECEAILPDSGMRAGRCDDDVRSVVDAALNVLVRRCLVFRLTVGEMESVEAHRPVSINEWSTLQDEMAAGAERYAEVFGDWLGKTEQNSPQEGQDTAWTGRRPWRFAVHRLVQRSLLRRLHAPASDLHRVEQFTLSLYLSQPDDLPRLSPESVADLRKLVAAWTGFPLDRHHIESATPYDRAKAEAGAAAEAEQGTREVTSLPARMLRAAFGMFRTVYSVPILSRLDAANDEGRPRLDEGYFEIHRRQIRWLLREAVLLNEQVRLGKAGSEPERERADERWLPILSGREDHDDAPSAPFMAEDIVWLYNECGLLSLIQGKLNDAEALFERALAAAERVEPSNEYGALWTRIHINKAYVDIERGHGRSAARYLRVIADNATEHPVIQACAHGLLGLIDHISGSLDAAQSKYDRALGELKSLRRSRAQSIFGRHLADLLRHKGQAFAVQAAEIADEAIANAAKGGHEDVRQLALLSRAQVTSTSAREHAGALRTIEAVSEYALRMGMPRLRSHTLAMHAAELIKRGENKHAANLTVRALEIAVEYDLRIRQVACLIILAKAYDARGLTRASRIILRRAYELADRCDYNHARTSIARQLSFDRTA